MSDPEPKLDENALARLALDFMTYDRVREATPKVLVEWMLLELDEMEVTSVQEFLIEELCSRVYPGWATEHS